MAPSRAPPEGVRQAASRFATAPAILPDARVWSYAALADASDGIAATVAEQVSVPGNRVGRYCPNGPAASPR